MYKIALAVADDPADPVFSSLVDVVNGAWMTCKFYKGELFSIFDRYNSLKCLGVSWPISQI